MIANLKNNFYLSNHKDTKAPSNNTNTIFADMNRTSTKYSPSSLAGRGYHPWEKPAQECKRLGHEAVFYRAKKLFFSSKTAS